MKASELVPGMHVVYQPITRELYPAIVLSLEGSKRALVSIRQKDGTAKEKSVPVQHLRACAGEAFF